MKVKLGSITRAQRKQLKLQEDNGMIVYMVEVLKRKVDEFEDLGKDLDLIHQAKEDTYQSGLIMSMDGHMRTQYNQEGTSDPSRMNLNESLRSMHQSIEKLARDVQDLKKAWHDDNLYEEYGDNPHVGQAYHGGYYGNQQGGKALDKIKWKVPTFKGENDTNVFLEWERSVENLFRVQN
ncbi:hypothetical protein M9H77_17559 [Catharanthus roseus]|uniref:Uncharacterized protein n=1 Tax=Catharanthus roseus TaxID=4058 RepID=A0ACC0B4Z5_CATRO|nr:hypothetical protein M9H77_17559 [Catharanthus roseus]